MILASADSEGVAAVRVLDVDPDLAEVLEEEQVREAANALVAPAITLAKGEWNPRQAVAPASGHLGVLVTEGILCRQVLIGDSACAELVGPGDLLRPWDGPGGSVLVSSDVRWQVLEEAQLAVLGQRFATVAARWPALTSALVARAISRSHALALSASISCTTGVEKRLSMLFWHMAERWGRVCREGVVVPVRMTHELIARLIAARRPSVSTALKQLEREGRITRLPGRGWLLTGDPPRAAHGDPDPLRGVYDGDGKRPCEATHVDRHQQRLEPVSGIQAATR